MFVPEAQAIETFAMTRRHEYDRRVRTQAGMYQLIRSEPRLLWPAGNPILKIGTEPFSSHAHRVAKRGDVGA